MNLKKLAANHLIDLVISILRRSFRNTKVHSYEITAKIYSLIMAVRTDSKQNKDYLVDFMGAKFLCESGDITILPTLISGEYEKYEVTRLLEFANMREKNFKLIDVGANIGIYSILFSKEVNRVSHTQNFSEQQGSNKEATRKQQGSNKEVVLFLLLSQIQET
jgi:hypothetical protein